MASRRAHYSRILAVWSSAIVGESVRSERLGAVEIGVARRSTSRCVAMHERPDYTDGSSLAFGFCDDEQGEGGSSPGFAQSGGWIDGTQVSGHRKSNRDDVVVTQGVARDKGVVELGYASFYIGSLISAKGSSAQPIQACIVHDPAS